MSLLGNSYYIRYLDTGSPSVNFASSKLTYCTYLTLSEAVDQPKSIIGIGGKTHAHELLKMHLTRSDLHGNFAQSSAL